MVAEARKFKHWGQKSWTRFLTALGFLEVGGINLSFCPSLCPRFTIPCSHLMRLPRETTGPVCPPCKILGTGTRSSYLFTQSPPQRPCLSWEATGLGYSKLKSSTWAPQTAFMDIGQSLQKLGKDLSKSHQKTNQNKTKFRC